MHEELRVRIGVGYTPNSVCRCPVHNAREGGAPLSKHRSTPERGATAFDIPLVVPKQKIIQSAEAIGFGGIGIRYNSFVHVDARERRARW